MEPPITTNCSAFTSLPRREVAQLDLVAGHDDSEQTLSGGQQIGHGLATVVLVPQWVIRQLALAEWIGRHRDISLFGESQEPLLHTGIPGRIPMPRQIQDGRMTFVAATLRSIDLQDGVYTGKHLQVSDFDGKPVDRGFTNQS